MLDQLQTVYDSSKYYLPVITLLIGVMGSVHCSTMCGAFVLTCSDTKRQNVTYQLGRLFSYTVLTLIIFMFSSIIKFELFSRELALVASILMGLAFIYIGVQGLAGTKLKVKFPIFIQSRLNKVWGQFISKKEKNIFICFIIGSLSILLPCGLLYSVVIPLGAIDSLFWACIAIFSFWVGTLPVMGFAPVLLKKVLIPFKRRTPILISCFFVFFGLLMIGVRVYRLLQLPASKVILEICH